jgi:hypothetical protein
MRMTAVTKTELSADGKCWIVHFSDGMVRSIELKRYAAKGPAFASFIDPAFVRSIRPIARGFILECPNGATLSSDGLRRSGKRIDLADGELSVLPAKPQRARRSA